MLVFCLAMILYNNPSVQHLPTIQFLNAMAPSSLISQVIRLAVLLCLCDHTHSQEYGTCSEPFTIFKHTLSSSNSQRDCANAFRIFPDIKDQGATKFHDGECAYQCKLELPFSCFKLHAPQTRFDEGLLHTKTLENTVSEKWQSVMSGNLRYEPFFDYNMAFWVQSLDDFIAHWQSDEDTESALEYIGIRWTLPSELSEDIDSDWFSILVHSADSQINFEFMSSTKPSLYDDVQWITDDIPRCTFKGMAEYPWNRIDEATIVPVRISRATSDTNKMHDFYTNIFEAEGLYSVDALDSKTIFFHLPETQIELQFTQRSPALTYGSFTVEQYESLLMETHDSIITSAYCGQDRWMDNHFE